MRLKYCWHKVCLETQSKWWAGRGFSSSLVGWTKIAFRYLNICAVHWHSKRYCLKCLSVHCITSHGDCLTARFTHWRPDAEQCSRICFFFTFFDNPKNVTLRFFEVTNVKKCNPGFRIMTLLTFHYMDQIIS